MIEVKVIYNQIGCCCTKDLTDGIFESGAYGVPSKSQNPTILGQGDPSSTQCSNSS